MKIGLINFNHRGVHDLGVPPVPPIGLEYLVDNLIMENHQVSLLDLCFLSPEEKNDAIRDFVNGKDFIGITLRNLGIDNFRLKEQQFFVDELKHIIVIIRKITRAPIVLGGQGFSIYPQLILEYVNADFGISGPGEMAFCHLLKNLENISKNTILTGSTDFDIIHRREMIDYSKYILNGGSPAIQTKVGCSQKCAFCVENTKKVRCRRLNSVVEELKILLSRNYPFIYIADAEFNSNISQANQFCDFIQSESLNFKWSAYFNVKPLTEELVRKVKESGCVMPCISVVSGNDHVLKTLGTGFSTSDIIRMADWFHKYDLPFTVDLIFGSPGENLELTRKTICLMNEIKPDIIGMNLGIRMYSNTSFGKRFLAGEFDQNGQIYGKIEDNDDLFFPIFYISDMKIEKYLEEICDNNPNYRLLGYSGFEGVNYKVGKNAG